MKKFTSLFLLVLLHCFSTVANGKSDSYSWECSAESDSPEKITGFYESAIKKGSYKKVRKLWKALNCKYQGKGRKLVVFLDGTWNDHKTHTNIWQLYKLALEHSKKNPIIPYYDKGVGSHLHDMFLGGLIGEGIEKDIRQAYRFLAETYKTGDEIYIFGFSRGAITARSLNGMIRFVGLLNTDSINKEFMKGMSSKQRASFLKVIKKVSTIGSIVKEFPKLVLSSKKRNEFIYDTSLEYLAYDLYDGYQKVPNTHEDVEKEIELNKNRVADHYSKKKYKAYYKNIKFWEPTVKVIGVFDTVACLGKKCETDPKNHHTDLYANRGFQALSIDEIRGMFEPLRFDDPSRNEGELEEVWLSGGHSDIGGGYDSSYTIKKSCDIERICELKSDDKENYYSGLETIALNWMIDKIKGDGIIPNIKTYPECYIGKIHVEYYKKRAPIIDQVGRKFIGYLPRVINKKDFIHSSVQKRLDNKCLFDAHPKYEERGIYKPSNLGTIIN